MTATVEATDVGHAVPTGFIDRHLLLVLRATDAQGREVSAASGPLLPPVAGESLAGAGGLLFAKLLTGADGAVPSPLWKEAAAQSQHRSNGGHKMVTRGCKR